MVLWSSKATMLVRMDAHIEGINCTIHISVALEEHFGGTPKRMDRKIFMEKRIDLLTSR